MAAAIFEMPMAVVSLVDDDRNWFLGVHGLDAAVRDVPRDQSLCGPVIAGEVPVVCANVRDEPRALANPFVRRHHVACYACAPIVNAAGHALGTVAVMDTVPRVPAKDQLDRLTDLAALVMAQLEVRRATHDALIAERRLRDAAVYAQEDAHRDRDVAMLARDDARRDRDDARSDRREAEQGRSDARSARDTAMRDRDVAERDRDVAERDRDEIEEYATALQRTLLPPLLPKIGGLSVSAHYHPASARQVGGDFYDVFALGPDRWAFFVGDVEGHGVDAAVATSLIRYTLRSAALHHRDLADALVELNEVLLRELDPRRFCTVLLGTIEPADRGRGFQVTLATGGHLPALLIDPSTATAEPVRSSGGMLVGAVEGASFQSCGLRLLPGQTLLLYTDGIVEARRGETAFGESSLAAFAAERAALDASALIGDLATLIPKLGPDDDVAVLAMTVLR